MESADRPRIVRFGVFEVDLRSNELFKDGHKIKIQELPFQILVALLEQPGEVVTREELQHRLWPQDTFVDFDHSLNTAVRLLRLALGDAAENPKFVETLPRKGYRFIYPVESLKRIITEGEVAQTRHPEGLRSFETSGHPISLEAPEPSHALPLSQLPHERETVREQPSYHSAPEPEVELQDFVLGTKQSQATEQKKQHRHVWAVAAITSVLLVAGSIYWMGRRGTQEPEPALAPVPFTTYEGLETTPSFSPDGNQVVFAWNAENKDFDLYIKQIGIEFNRRLTRGPDHSMHPVWSPDGQFIAFLRVFRVSGKWKTMVMTIPANGGRERQVAEVPMQKITEGQKVLCWHPSGKWLAMAGDQEPADAPSAIYLLSLETGERRRLTSPPKRVKGDNSPAFSPDGRSLAFERDLYGVTTEIYLLSVSEGLWPEGELKQLTFMNQNATSPAWMPDGKEIIYSSGCKDPDARLWRIPVSGSGQPRRLSFSSEENQFDPAISLTKHRLVYMTYSFYGNIWRCQVPIGKGKFEPPKKLTASTRPMEFAQYSPDGKTILFGAWTSGSEEIWVCDKDGSNPIQLTHLGGPIPGFFRWSPDGQKIILSLASSGQTDLYVIPARGGVLRQLTHTPFLELKPSFSRDQKWVYFISDRTGDFQIWKMPADGGDSIQVTREVGVHLSDPQESMDGKILFYRKKIDSGNDELWKIPVIGGDERRILEKVSGWNFEVKAHGIYYVSQPGPDKTPLLLFYDVASGKKKTIATVQNWLAFAFSISPDEREILYVQNSDARADLMLVENFR